MSRNFELLQQAGLHQELFASPAAPPPINPNASDLHDVPAWARPGAQDVPPGQSLNASQPGDFPDAGQQIPPAPSLFFPADGTGREEATKLVRRLFLRQRLEAPRMVVLTGARKGVGCSWVCALTSQVLAAQVRQRVCVVDANLRAPSLHKYFRMKNQSGLSDFILRSEPAANCATQIQGSNLWLLPAGQALPHFSNLASVHSLHSWMTELRGQFDYVIVDSPPVNSYADAIILGQVSDGMVLVVEYSRTPKEAALRAKQSVEAANIPLLGAVLNKRTFTIPKALYRFLR